MWGARPRGIQRREGAWGSDEGGGGNSVRSKGWTPGRGGGEVVTIN